MKTQGWGKSEDRDGAHQIAVKSSSNLRGFTKVISRLLLTLPLWLRIVRLDLGRLWRAWLEVWLFQNLIC
jgi:hypothetical protein